MTRILPADTVRSHRLLLAASTLLLLAAGTPAATLGSRAPLAQAPDTVRDLRSVLDTGWILRDPTGDGTIDALAVRIVFPEEPTQAEVVAAANVAARLGYEAVALDPELAEDDGARTRHDLPVVAVGARNRLLGGRTGPAGAAAGLAPGQGAVRWLPADPSLVQGGVAVVGADESGLLHAAAWLSGRYPAIWDPAGTEWRALAEKLASFLDARELTGGTLRLERVVVDRDRPGVARLEASLSLPDSARFARALAAFEGSDSAGAAGTGPAGGAPPAPGPDSAGAEAPPSLADLEVADLHRLDLHLSAPGRSRVVRLLPRRPWSTEAGEELDPPAESDFGLPDLYRVGGLFRDGNRDLVPDATAGWLAVGDGAAPEAVIALAARIGLETAGIRLPLARAVGEEDAPEREGLPVLVGVEPYPITRLRAGGKLQGGPPAPGEGFVQVVPDAFGESPSVAIGGGDGAGLAAALEWASTRAPYLWTHGKGEVHLEDLETEVRRFLQVRTAAGQAALALWKLERWLERIPAGTSAPASVEVELSLERAPAGLAALLEKRVLARFPGIRPDVRTTATGFGVGDTIFRQAFDVPWEVDEAKSALDAALPALRAGAPVRVELRLSEPPEVRRGLEEEIRQRVSARGAPAEVVVLSAYKQGYSWIEDVLLPRLTELPVASVDIRYHTLEESEEVRWQTIAAETRWLQELYPIDAVLARELSIPDSAIAFHPVRRPDAIYQVTARDAAGGVLLEETFTPRYVVRPFFDLFPEYEQVRVTTGWISVVQDGDTLLDRRVRTDPEAFWDVLQQDTYRRIVEYVMDIQDGQPDPDLAPYFDELTVELSLSEPNHRIGVDEEVISSLEALHEDIYFETLTLFDLIGNRYDVGGLSYPGRVLPRIDPHGAGRPGHATITLTGKAHGVPELVLRTTSPEGRVDVDRYPLAPLPLEPPTLRGVSLAAGAEGLRRVLVEVPALDSLDPWEEHRGRNSEPALDRAFLPVELFEGMLAALGELHDAGLFADQLSWDRIGELALRFRLERDSSFVRIASLPRSAAPASTDNPRLLAEGWRWRGERLVQWETPIPPAESDSVLARLATFPGVRAYFMTRSFLGQPVWAADFLPPMEGRLVSQAKLNALRPTLLVSGRQHANEVSSTSHILRLGELLATDSTYRALLGRVNVVLHPVTNPDGARLAVEMQETNPDFMLHAGYLGALGVDATSGERTDDPVYPEALVRRRLRETWLPDAYVNMHGYPSHEWVQYFAGYSAWVRGRDGGQRSWWSPRGWFVPGFGWVDDPENPDYTTAQFAMLDSVAASITGEPRVEAMNRRLYGRYGKYGRQDRDQFREYFHNGILVYLALRGQEEIGQGVYSPRITYFSTATEAPDETARGDWLDLVASAGLAHSSALLRYLAGGTFETEREAEAWRGLVTRSVYRVKPVLPPERGDEAGTVSADEAAVPRPSGGPRRR